MSNPRSSAPKPAAKKPAPAPAAAPVPAAAPPPAPAGGIKSIFTNLPALLTAIGGVIAAIATFLTSADKVGWLRHPTPTLEPTAVETATLAATDTPQPTLTFTLAPTQPPATPTPPPPSPTPTSALPEGVTLMDDFSDPTPAWDTGADGTYEVGYQDGEYRIVVNEADSTVWGSPTKPYDLADFALEVDARQLRGPKEASYGVVVRVQPDARFYMCAIASDGTYSIQQLQGQDNWATLRDWTESAAIRPLGEVNHLRVECLGERMRFYVNDEMLAEVSDLTLPSGTIGLVASSVNAEVVEVRFDNLRLEAIKKL